MHHSFSLVHPTHTLAYSHTRSYTCFLSRSPTQITYLLTASLYITDSHTELTIYFLTYSLTHSITISITHSITHSLNTNHITATWANNRRQMTERTQLCGHNNAPKCWYRPCQRSCSWPTDLMPCVNERTALMPRVNHHYMLENRTASVTRHINAAHRPLTKT